MAVTFLTVALGFMVEVPGSPAGVAGTAIPCEVVGRLGVAGLAIPGVVVGEDG